jgi:nitrogen fixation protein
MGQSAVKNPRKIFSQAGADPALNNRVTNLENNEYKITYYEVVSGTSGSLTIPANSTINTDEFGLSGNAILSKIDGSNKPTYESPQTVGGVVVTASLNTTTGAWVASGTYTDATVALIYSIKIKAIYYSNLNYDRIIETVNMGNSGGTGYVPYTGATANVDLGEFELKAGQIELDQSPTGTAGVAVTRWNDTIGSTETTLKGGSVIIKNGVDLVARVVNKVTPNTTLTKADYQVVKVSGAQNQRLAVDFAQGNNDLNSADTIGVVTETIATNQEGFILTVGQLEGINTTGSLQSETWADGDVLYLSPTTAGRMTNIKPTGLTGHIVVLGYVEYAHINNGKIYVKIMNGWELDELHNVYINPTTLANNDVLTYDSSSSLWKNKQSNYLQIVSKDITDSTALTGTTTITLMKSILIPANTYATGDVVKLLNRAIRSTATGTAINYFYINTTNSLTGATLVGTQSSASRYYANERNLYIKSTTVSETINVITSISSDTNVSSVNANSNLNIDWTVNQYIIAAFQNAAVGNSTIMSSLIIQKF